MSPRASDSSQLAMMTRTWGLTSDAGQQSLHLISWFIFREALFRW